MLTVDVRGNHQLIGPRGVDEATQAAFDGVCRAHE
jgi:hypothetical protein